MYVIVTPTDSNSEKITQSDTGPEFGQFGDKTS